MLGDHRRAPAGGHHHRQDHRHRHQEPAHWANIRDTFTKADPKWPKSAQIAGQIWADDGQTKLWMVPTVYNYDSIGYNPDVVSAEEANTWTAIFDKKWKGRSGLNTDPLIAFGQAIVAMNSLGLLDVKNPGNPSAKDIDEAAKFLVSKKKDGQFRALWGDFGELVNLLASGEMVVCDAWQPAVMAVKAQGKACKYAVPKEGYRAWSIGVSMIKGTPNPDAVIAYADYWLSGPPAITVSEQGYSRRPLTSRKRWLPTNTPSGTRASRGRARIGAASRKAICVTAARSRSAPRRSRIGTDGPTSTTTSSRNGMSS